MPDSVLSAISDNLRSKFNLDDLLVMFSIDVESHVVKKNNRPIFRGRIGKSEKLRSAERHLTISLRSQGNKQGLYNPINEPIWAVFMFHFPREVYMTKKGVISEKLPDLSNLIQLPEDCLQDAGIIKNDTLIHSLDLSRRIIGPSYKLEIFILKYGIRHS